MVIEPVIDYSDVVEKRSKSEMLRCNVIKGI
jgi:hypothetical protein